MFIAIDKKTGHKIDIEDAIINKEEYVCPICHGELIVKNGDINTPHFAHKTLSDCDTFTADMSEWHKSWQEKFSKENREVVLTLEIGEFDLHSAAQWWNFSKLSSFDEEEEFEFLRDKYPSGKEIQDKVILKHRADVCINGYVIEFQNSPISAREFNERNWFYTACGYKVVWIFNFQDKYNHTISRYYRDNYKKNPVNKYRWSNNVKTFKDFSPQFHKLRKEDDEWIEGDVFLFFQFFDSDNYVHKSALEKIIWAPYEDEYEESNFSVFFCQR